MNCISGTFGWDKKLPILDLAKVIESQDKIKITATKDCIYYGRALSSEEKWKKGFEIAGIIVCTLLILPIPILVFTGLYKHLARLFVELKKNISIEGKIINKVKINVILSKFLMNKNGYLRDKIEKFEAKNDHGIVEKASKYEKVNGISVIEVGIREVGRKEKILAKIEYEFRYDKNKPINERLTKKLINSELNREELNCYSDEKLHQTLYFSRDVDVKNEKGKLVKILGFHTSENCQDLDITPRK